MKNTPSRLVGLAGIYHSEKLRIASGSEIHVLDCTDVSHYVT